MTTGPASRSSPHRAARGLGGAIHPRFSLQAKSDSRKIRGASGRSNCAVGTSYLGGAFVVLLAAVSSSLAISRCGGGSPHRSRVFSQRKTTAAALTLMRSRTRRFHSAGRVVGCAPSKTEVPSHDTVGALGIAHPPLQRVPLPDAFSRQPLWRNPRYSARDVIHALWTCR